MTDCWLDRQRVTTLLREELGSDARDLVAVLEKDLSEHDFLIIACYRGLW